MCGRFTLHTPEEKLREIFHLEHTKPLSLVPRYNIAPSQDILIIRETIASQEMVLARWGLVPHWSKVPDTKYSTINARVESVAEKPTYKTPLRKQRCLVPADGYYEWQKSGNIKTPYFIHMPKHDVFAFAGIWDHWGNGDEAFDSCSIITLPSDNSLAKIHPRMPAIIAPAHYDWWLDTRITEPREIMELLKSAPSGGLDMYPVSTWVNKPQNDGIQCIRPVKTYW